MRELLYTYSDLELMMANIYGEARFIEGDMSDDIREYLAIGQVVLNRANDLSQRWPRTVRDVILQAKQFSWTNEGDKSLPACLAFLRDKTPLTTYKMLEVYCTALLEKRVMDFSYGATHYVARWLYERKQKPDWINKLTITATWGGHIFLIDPEAKANF